ncbi:transglycosylase SLT domain-containing protein [Bacteriovorax sp. DB6_IX]|uniref:transglycosylase SLT domain-containing protein n=1 Tax=Bacteriovorax sp. DB6_IX TaxID=1353530 RepID=UPI0003FAE824|nr:transglycosylase SLT domain-containing protein [Bacteriovorax sp. DB6_IX]
MRIGKLILLSILILNLTSCGPGNDGDNAGVAGDQIQDQSELDVDANSVHPKILAASGGPWKKEWSETIARAIDLHGANLLNHHISEVDLEAVNCLGYNQASHSQKKQFWKVLFASVARYESNYKSEKMKPRNYRDVIRSRQNKVPMGILQLGTEATAHGQGCSGANSAQWLLNPIRNLECGVQIMNNQLSGGKSGRFTGVIGRIFPDRPRYEGSTIHHYYWSVLTYGDSCTPTSKGCRYGKKDRVIERVVEQLNLSENYELFDFCHR